MPVPVTAESKVKSTENPRDDKNPAGKSRKSKDGWRAVEGILKSIRHGKRRSKTGRDKDKESDPICVWPGELQGMEGSDLFGR